MGEKITNKKQAKLANASSRFVLLRSPRFLFFFSSQFDAHGTNESNALKRLRQGDASALL
jgi:hypothetical protein